VQPLIEALGELVSQVSLIIVQNKAQNKAPPQELPMCVMGIQVSLSCYSAITDVYVYTLESEAKSFF
jgi:hypothetical protein